MSAAGKGNISAWAIRQPIPSIVLFILLTLAGLIGFTRLGINQYPDVDIPMVTVTISDPGAAPSELETQVTRIVEDSVATVGDVAHISSSVTDGVSVTQVEFVFGKDIDRAVNDVRDAVTRVRGELPGSIEEPVISRNTTSGGPMQTYTVRAPGLSAEELSWFVDNEVAKTLLTVPGVGSVARIGGVDREIQVSLDPARLHAHGITAAEVSRQLQEVNVDVPGGKARLGAQEQSIRTLGSAASIEQLGALQIAARDGRQVRLSDLGEVRDAFADPVQDALVDGERVVAFQVVRAVGSSSVSVARAVQEAVARLDAAQPGVDIALFNSTVDFTLESYHASIEALILGAILAVIVVFWFLRDWRATLISAVAMPLSVIPTFFFMSWLGFTLNVITLLGLSLVVGILVDDAIVEVENIVRHMRMGKKPFRAALEAADEIGLAVVATTFAIVAVFIPVCFMGGVPGQFFRQFGLSVAVAVVISLLVARLITPVMGAYFLKAHGEVAREGRLMRAYLRLVDWGLAHRRLALLSGVGLFAASVAIGPHLAQSFLPASDRSMSVINFELAPGARLEETVAAAEAARKVLAAHPEVTGVLAVIGNGASLSPMGISSSGEVRAGTLTVALVPEGERALSQREFEKKVEPELRAIPGLRFRFGGSGNGGELLDVVLVGDDPQVLQEAAEKVEREMRGIPGVGNPSASSGLRRPELLIRPDLARAADLGITVADIATTIRVATIGEPAAQLPKFNLEDRSLPIRTQLPESARGDLDALRLLQVPTPSGSVAIDAVAELSIDSGNAEITRFDRRRSVSIKADVAGAPLGTITQALERLPSMKALPAGVRQAQHGDTERMKELFSDFGIAMVAGVLLVYCVLVLLFHDFAQPVTIMAALPLSVGGALGLLLATGEPMSLPATIGILMLMGIVTKNSILLVEYALVAVHGGAERRAALLDACSKRAQPIVMTTVAMGAGMLPIALKIGADADFRAPMAIAVIGGLVTSTVLSLFYVPVVFTYVDDVKRALQRSAARSRERLATAAGKLAQPAPGVAE